LRVALGGLGFGAALTAATLDRRSPHLVAELFTI
jgi:hypothetical protein